MIRILFFIRVGNVQEVFVIVIKRPPYFLMNAYILVF